MSLNPNEVDSETADAPYSDLADAAQNDPDRVPVETETGFLFSKSDDRMMVNTAETALMRRLLNHPEFDLKRYETTNGDGEPTSRDAETYTDEGHDARKPVYSVSGSLPIGCLKVSATGRKSGGHADVISGEVL